MEKNMAKNEKTVEKREKLGNKIEIKKNQKNLCIKKEKKKKNI